MYFFLRCRHCKKPCFFCKVETHFTTTSRILLPCLLRQPFFFLVLSRRYYAVSFALKIASSLVSSKRPPVNLKDCRPLTCVLISLSISIAIRHYLLFGMQFKLQIFYEICMETLISQLSDFQRFLSCQ